MSGSNRKPFGGDFRAALEGFAKGRGLPRTSIVIASAIASFANIETGLAWPGNQKIMERAHVSKKTLDRHLVLLKAKGVIIPYAYPNGGKGKAVEYRFPLPPHIGYQKPAHNAGFALANHGQKDGSLDEVNHGHSVPKPRSFCPDTTVKESAPSREKNIEEGNEAPPSRGEVDKKVASSEAPTSTDVPIPINPIDAIGLLARKGINTTVASVGAGINDEALAYFGYVVTKGGPSARNEKRGV